MELTHPQNVLTKREKVNMSDDLVKRLRCYADIDDAVYNPWVYGEAADRIEKLEAALREIAALGFWDGDSAMSIASKALEGKDD
jgi:hypothetical protein